MKYFIPDWEDRLDPNYNFETDTFSRDKSSAYDADIYSHQVFVTPPYDGILISLSVFKNKLNLTLDENGKKKIRRFSSIKDYLRINKNSNLKVLGDCGAFSYINEDIPPEDYDIDKVANLYDSLKFDYGVSVDHMIPDFIVKKSETNKLYLSKDQKEFRRILSIENAKEFITYHKRKGFNYIPIGAVQGYSPETYADSAAQVISMGYSYIGIGTLVPKSDEEIIEILKEVKKVIGKREIKVHLFGILRLQKLAEFRSLGVTSFDSSSFLRKAWLRIGRNYVTKDGNWYAAIRVPYSENSVLVNNAKKAGYSLSDIQEMEKKALKAIKEYANNKTEDVEEVLKTVLEYDILLLREYDGNHHYDKYKKTLIDRPWEKCNCEICKSIGVDVIIFRGANRNKRRGFHNTKIFYDYILNSHSGH